VGWVELAAGRGDGADGRYGFGMAYDVSRARTVLFGGTDGFNVLGDTWEWDGTVWQQVATTGPAARVGSALVYDSRRARVLLCGGSTTEVITMDLWEWAGRPGFRPRHHRSQRPGLHLGSPPRLRMTGRGSSWCSSGGS
jgi:hypothetical protein